MGEEEPTVQDLARRHRSETGHRFNGIDGYYAPCVDCLFVAERVPLGVIASIGPVALRDPDSSQPIPVRPDGCVSGVDQTEGAVT